MTYNPKINWQYGDIVTEQDLNRIEQAIWDISKNRGTEIVIAPYNSSEKDKTGFVLTGADDQIMINEIISSLVNGGSILFLDGDIQLTDAVKVKDYMKISGLGMETRFNLSNNSIGFTQIDTSKNLLRCIFKDFGILGDGENSTNTQTIGMRLSPQESIFENIRVYGCKDGFDLNAEFGASVMNFISKCLFLSNVHLGIRLGSDSILTQCIIGDNANLLRHPIDYDSCGLKLGGWGNQVYNNHFYKNAIGIRSEWAVGNVITGNLFESGYKEDIFFAGCTEAVQIANNVFHGKDKSANQDLSMYNSITFEGASSTNVQNNSVIGNSFLCFSEEYNPNIRYNYCIAEGINCNNNFIISNNFNGFYKQENPVYKTGENTIIDGYNPAFTGTVTLQKIKSNLLAEIDAADTTGGTLISDTLCFKGQSAQLLQPSSSPAAKSLSVTIGGLRYGQFSVAFRIKSNNNTTGSTVATLQISDGSGGNSSSLALIGTNFTNTTAYQMFYIPLNNIGQFSGNNIKLTLTCAAIANLDLRLDSIIIAPIHLGVFGA